MTAMLPLNLLFLSMVLLSEFLQVHGISIPILRSYHSDIKKWPSNMCTSNVTIPTVSERVRCNLIGDPCPTSTDSSYYPLQCISSCSSMQKAQTICRDNTLCMCSIARSPDLEACFDCILEGIGTFVDSIPHQYIESLQHQISVYTASCELQGQLLRNQSTITLNPNESSEAAQMITLCSTDNSRHSHLLADSELDNNTPGPSWTFHSDFHKLFPIFSFTLAVVFLLIMRLHKSKC